MLQEFLPLDYVDALREQLSPLMLGEYEKAQGDEFTRGRGAGRLAMHLDQYAKLLGGLWTTTGTDDTPDLDAEHEPIRVTYNIPLTDFSAVNGAAEFIPGSHRLPRSATRDLPILSIPHVFPVLLGLRKGDAVLRDARLIGGISARRRVSVPVVSKYSVVRANRTLRLRWRGLETDSRFG